MSCSTKDNIHKLLKVLSLSQTWKCANVVSVYKMNKKNLNGNYLTIQNGRNKAR